MVVYYDNCYLCKESKQNVRKKKNLNSFHKSFFHDAQVSATSVKCW